MAGNQFGKIFTLSTFGESHGSHYGCIVDGCPPGLELSIEDIQPDLDRRRPGRTRITSQRREPDSVQILSGVYEGKTTGTPIGLLIANVDARPRDYTQIQDQFRPGHADFTYQHKYGIRDPRGGGRSSARETMMRVAAGAIAKKWLHLHFGTFIKAYVAQIGDITLPFKDVDAIETNDFFCADPSKITELENYIKALRKQGDSIGARVNVFATHVPIGLGEPVYNGLDAELARAFMSINAAKGVEIGAGFQSITQLGSQHRDGITPTGFLSNHSGGTLGGISTGQNIEASIAFKPASSIPTPVQSIDKHNQICTVQTTGRHDPCVGIRAVPIVEAMLALVLMDHCLLQRCVS